MNDLAPTKKQLRLCVVTPCFNEEEVVELFYGALRDVLISLEGLDYRILFVDDGSTDGTLAKLNAIAERDRRVRVYSLSRNFGHQVALTAGLEAARGAAVVMMDCDLQHPPELIPKMVQLWREGNDVVSAVRTSTASASWFKRFSAGAFYWMINRLSDTPILTGAADFCLLSRRAHQALRAMPERHRFLRGMVSWIGFRRAVVPFEAPPRAAGKSKYTLLKMVGLALNATFSFSAAPIRLASRVGLAVVLCGAAYLIYILGRFALFGDLVPGWGSLICTVLLLGGAQLVFIGLIGEYLARVFDEAKGRPLYLLKQVPRQRRRRPAPEPTPVDAAETDS